VHQDKHNKSGPACPSKRPCPARGFHFLICFFALALLAVLSGSSPVYGADKIIGTPQVGDEPVDRPTAPPAQPTLMLTALDRPVDPEVYLVGPGDELAVNVWGGVHRGFKVTVTPEASAIVPTVGEIPLSGMTLAQAKRSILRRIGKIYPGVPATVTLIQVRWLRVAVTGAVEEPGMCLVTANVRACEAIATAGWQETSSRRRIVLFRGGDTLRVDELRFARTGNEMFNPYLTEGDLIFVPHARVGHGVFEIYGSVNRPGIFEFVEGDRLEEAIELAFGFAVDADTTAVELVRFLGDDSLTAKHVIDLCISGPGLGRKMNLQPDDRIFVRPRIDYRLKASVRIAGEVIRPGRYPIENGRTLLSELLVLCGGVTERADLSRATLVRADRFLPGLGTNERIRSIPGELQTGIEREWILAHSLTPVGRVSINLKRLLQTGEKAYDLPLWDGDAVRVPRFLPQVNVIGRVQRPGLIPHIPGCDLDYYIERAGGLSWHADRSGVFVLKGTTGMPVEKKKVKQLDAGDTIVIPTVREKKFWPILRDAMVVLGNIATLYLVIDQAAR